MVTRSSTLAWNIPWTDASLGSYGPWVTQSRTRLSDLAAAAIAADPDSSLASSPSFCFTQYSHTDIPAIHSFPQDF